MVKRLNERKAQTMTVRIDFVGTADLTIDQAGRLQEGDRVRHSLHGSIGEVVPGRLPGMLRIDWVETPWYDHELGDYIASSEYDLLDIDDWSDTLPLRTVR
jgi:hypothetical protein